MDFTEYDKNCFTIKVITIVLLYKNLNEIAVHKVLAYFSSFVTLSK